MLLVLGHTLGGPDETVGKGPSCRLGPGSLDSPGTLRRADGTHTGSLFSLFPEREGASGGGGPRSWFSPAGFSSGDSQPPQPVFCETLPSTGGINPLLGLRQGCIQRPTEREVFRWNLSQQDLGKQSLTSGSSDSFRWLCFPYRCWCLN